MSRLFFLPYNALTIKELGAKKVVSRASREMHRQFLLRNGADEVVYPEAQLASWTAIRNTTDHIPDYIALDGEYAIYDISVPAEWCGKTVGDLDIRHMGRRLDGFRLEKEEPDSLLFVKADARLIVQVVINLLDNAIKYAPAGSKISIGISEKGKNVLVRVADEGPGIPDDQKGAVALAKKCSSPIFPAFHGPEALKRSYLTATGGSCLLFHSSRFA